MKNYVFWLQWAAIVVELSVFVHIWQSESFFKTTLLCCPLSLLIMSLHILRKMKQCLPKTKLVLENFPGGWWLLSHCKANPSAAAHWNVRILITFVELPSHLHAFAVYRLHYNPLHISQSKGLNQVNVCSCGSPTFNLPIPIRPHCQNTERNESSYTAATPFATIAQYYDG